MPLNAPGELPGMDDDWPDSPPRAVDIFAGFFLTLAVAAAGFLFGWTYAAQFLPNLDVNLNAFDSRTRIYAWSLLSALGFGLACEFGLAVIKPFLRGVSYRRLIAPYGRSWMLALAGSVVIAIVLQGIAFSARASARDMYCVNNLKAIALAMYQYHDEFGCLPPAYIPDQKGVPMHSWRVLVLPCLAKVLSDRKLERLYASYRFDEPWDGPNNRK